MVADSNRGSATVLLVARSDALGHVTRVKSVPGSGVWVADLTADTLGLKPGGTIHIQYGNAVAVPDRGSQDQGHLPRARQLGAVRVLGELPARRSCRRAWTRRHPSRYVFLSRGQLLRARPPARRAAGSSTTGGGWSRIGSGFALVDDGGTGGRPTGPDHRARPLAGAELLATLRQELRASVPRAAHSLCTGPRSNLTFNPARRHKGNPSRRCSGRPAPSPPRSRSPTPMSVEISPVVTLLSGVGDRPIALAFAGAAGALSRPAARSRSRPSSTPEASALRPFSALRTPRLGELALPLRRWSVRSGSG